MLNVAKALHLLGLAMFLGSVFGHITVGFVPGADREPETVLFARQAIEAATLYVTIPGLILVLLTGIFMMVYGRMGFFRVRWLTIHQILGGLIFLNAVLILYPVGGELAAAAGQLVQGSLSLEQFQAIAARERTFGPINVFLALATVFIAVLKPRFGTASR